MQQKEKASAQVHTLAKAQTEKKVLTVDIREAEKYSQHSKFPACSYPKKCRLLLMPGWYYLREEIGSDEAELIRFLDYWIRKNYLRWKSPRVYWTYEKLAGKIRIPKRTLQRKVAKLIKADLLDIQGSGPLWFKINYDHLLDLEKDIMAKVALHDAKLATYLEGKE